MTRRATMRDASRAWWGEYGDAVVALGMAVVALTVVVGACALASADDDRQCAKIMSHARSPRDSLDASIACANIREETARTIAISAAAGAVAASASSSYRGK